MVLFNEGGGVYLVCWVPCVIAFQVPFPFEEILQFLLSSKEAVIAYCFYLVFIFFNYEVRWWSGVIGSVFFGFDIWG